MTDVADARSVLSRAMLPVTIPTLTTIALAAFDGVAVVAALPGIGADLGDVALISWVITAFLVASAISMLLAGPAIDALGLRTTFRVTVVAFLVTSVACAAAPTIGALVVARAAQGLAGGLVIAVGLASIGLAYPTHLRARGYAANSVVWGGMALGGPALAALLVATTGWRGIFLVNVPLCALAAAVGWNRFAGPAEPGPGRLPIDRAGLALLGAFTVVSLVGVSSLDARAAVAAVGAIALGAAYVRYAARARAPVLEPRFFAHMPYVGMHVASAAAFGGALGVNSYLPLYVQGALGRSATLAALSVLFLSVGWTAGALTVSRVLDHVSETAVALAGYVFLVPPLVLAALVYGTGTSPPLVFTLSFAQGVGIGLLSTALLTLLQARTQAAGIGRATSAHQYVRTLGFTYAAAAVAAVIFFVVDRRLGDSTPVRRLLDGEDLAGSDAVRAAIASGYRWAHLAVLALVSTGLGAAVALRRQLGGERATRRA